MKRLHTGAWIGVIAAACVATLAAQAPANRAAIEKTLTDNEQAINAAFIKGDAAGMKPFIADDAIVIQGSGRKTVAQFWTEMPTMQIKVTEQHMTDFKFLWVDASTVIETYSWTGKGTVMGQAVKPTYASTVWTKRGEKWVAVHHQETDAAPMPGMAMTK